MGKLAVVALGGNALLRGHQDGTIDEQEQNTKDTLENLMFLIKEGYDLVISHGNGPQVGNILMRNDAGFETYKIPPMPLDICVADSQGGIGYMIERILRNVLVDHGIVKDVVTMVTQVVVDKNDPLFQNPTKRVGKIYSKEEADALSHSKGWAFKPDPKKEGGWRRVVPSPEPIDVFNAKSIGALARSGTIVIASGGGGIPVYYDEKNYVRPLDAVIDKDNASSLLGTLIGADEFYILTDVPYIYLDFQKPTQRIAEFLNVADAKKYLAEGQFGEGSMGPKIKAAVKFVENGGKMSVITESTKLEDTKYGSKITQEYEN
jgi:carbamate kinase